VPRLYVEAMGCTLNRAETWMLAEAMRTSGYEIVPRPEDADVILFGTCVVIQRTEQVAMNALMRFLALGKEVIVSGCLPAARPELLDGLPVRRITPSQLPEAHRILGLSRPVLDSVPRLDSLAVGIPIADGCLGACSYCITKVARPRLRSYRPELIVENVKRALAMGYREIRLTAPDTAAYGTDIGSSLPELLEMVAGLEGDFMVRVGMMNPNTASRIWDDLMEVYSHPRVFKFLHLPVQSGDDRVLRDMRRGYTVQEFEELVRDFRSRHEGLLSTDVIVGYPTEDEEAFRNTVELVERVRPDILNITRFSRRPGTPAWRLKPLPSQELKRRSRLLTELHRRISLENNSRFVGRRMRVLVLEEGKGGTVLARAPSYRPVVLDAAPLGRWVEAEIVDYSFVYLRGRRVAD